MLSNPELVHFIRSRLFSRPKKKKKSIALEFYLLPPTQPGWVPTPTFPSLGRPQHLKPISTIKKRLCQSPVTIIPPRDPPRSGHPRWEMTAGQGPGWRPSFIFQGLGFGVRLTWARSWLLLWSALPLCVSEFSSVKLGFNVNRSRGLRSGADA